METNHEQKLAEKKHSGFLMTQTLLRILGIVFTVSAIVLMVTSKQIIEIFTVQFIAKYSYSPAFKYFVGANIAAITISALSLLPLWVYADPPYFAVFVSDFIATILGVSGFAAASAIGYLGKYGNIHSFWNPICDTMEMFTGDDIVPFKGRGKKLILNLISCYFQHLELPWP